MSWSISVNDVEADDIYRGVIDEFERQYPEPADGVSAQVSIASSLAHEIAHDAALMGDDGMLYRVQASGHVHDEDADSFISIIVTKKDAARPETAAPKSSEEGDPED